MRPLDAPAAIAVFRALQLGDLLCAVPALRALRHAHPRARVTLIGLPWARAFAARFARYVDDFLEFPGFPGMPERDCDVRALPEFLRAAQARHFDVALQLHGSGALSNPLVAALGARRAAGYCRSGDAEPRGVELLPWRDGEHEILRYLRLLAALGVPPRDVALEFPLTPEDEQEAARLGVAPDGAAYACVHPGSQLPSRRWLPERFAAVADALAERGLAIVLTGTAAEAPLTARVAAAMRTPALDLAGRTSLGSLAALVDGARLVVANDTGIVHVARARGVPSVAVSCGGDVGRWAPLAADSHRVVHYDVPCRPCAHRDCPIGHPCAAGVSTADVLAAAAALLAKPARTRRAGACAA